MVERTGAPPGLPALKGPTPPPPEAMYCVRFTTAPSAALVEKISTRSPPVAKGVTPSPPQSISSWKPLTEPVMRYWTIHHWLLGGVPGAGGKPVGASWSTLAGVSRPETPSPSTSM